MFEDNMMYIPSNKNDDNVTITKSKRHLSGKEYSRRKTKNKISKKSRKINRKK